jgi:hypothetical protein
MKKIIVMTLILCILSNMAVISTHAFMRPPPESYKIEVDGGNKVFVMIPPGQTFGVFAKSGLYYNTELFEMIYTIDEYFYNDRKELFISICGFYFAHSPLFVDADVNFYADENTYDRINELFISTDGQYFKDSPFFEDGEITIDLETPWTARPAIPAIRFFYRGEVFRSYEVSALINLTDSYFPLVIPYFIWDEHDRRHFYRESNDVTFSTLAFQFLMFDITTGLIWAFRLGDINDDWKVDTTDVMEILRYVAGLPNIIQGNLRAFSKADVNGDGVVDVADALIVLRMAAGLIPLDSEYRW